MNTMTNEIDLREVSGATFYFFNNLPHLKVDGDALELSSEAFDTLLNTLKVPIKYLQRYANEDPEQAQANVNFWLGRSENIGAVIDSGTISRIYDSRRLFVPVSAIKQSVTQYLGNKNVFDDWENNIYIGVFPTNNPEIELANGDTAIVSIRIQFSECFSIVPRIDAVLTIRGKYENYYFPIQGRKFRVVQATSSQIINQIIEFIDLVTEQTYKLFVPALNRMIEANASLNAAAFVGRLCSELRISRKIGSYLMTGIEEQEVPLHELVRKVGNNVLPEVRPNTISLETAREIELALSRAIYKGSFK